jgi:hypothetical protein
MPTSEDICNLTLTYLGKGAGDRVQSLSAPGNEIERLFALIFPQARDHELRRHFWNCAHTVKSLPQLAAVLTDTPRPYQYDIPTDYLQGIRTKTAEWQRRRDRLLSSIPTTLTINYVARIDGAEMDPLLAEALARRMQMMIARPTTKSNPEYNNAKEEYLFAVAEARRANAMEEGPINLRDEADDPNDGWLGARYY